MIFDKLFGRKKRLVVPHERVGAGNAAEFVSRNVAEVKGLLSSVGYNDVTRRLEDLALMTHCHAVALCMKMPGPNKFIVVESSDRHACQRGTAFAWNHAQPTASSDAAQVLETLPFDVPGVKGFISVPIKNSHNILTGILLGLANESLTDLSSKTQLMHIMAPFYESEVRAWKLKQDNRQMEQRIASLNQNIEVMSADLRRQQELAMESREIKSIFLTNLSHEIRTPMNAIVGFIDLLGSTEDPEERKNFMKFVKQSSHQLLFTIDSLIDISKLQSNYMLKPACPVQLNSLLTHTKEKYQKVLAEMGKEVVIETIFSQETPNDTIWNSDEIITKALDRIMDNACRYTQTGKITVSYSINHKEATFCITDTGPGLKPGTEEQIFELFSEDMQAEKKHGIGLAMAKKYLSLVNGRIWADTSYRNGACLYFAIPTEKL